MSISYFNPVSECQLCGVEFNEKEPMYDARLLPHSTWANICGKCFEANGCKLGTGYGQKYELKEMDDDKGSWVKVEG